MAQPESEQPIIRAAVRGTTGSFTANNVEHPITGADEREVRSRILSEVTSRARLVGRPVILITEDDLGQGQLLVHPDGTIEERGEFAVTAPTTPTAPTAAFISSPPAAPPTVAAVPAIVTAVLPAPTQPQRSSGLDSAELLPTRRTARQSFLTREEVEEPATQGIRGALSRLGIRVSPSEAERQEREWTRLVSQHWPGPRTIAIVNGKGGVGKTMTTISLSSVFARYGGAGVLAWDNNQTRGTLGWSTEQGPHDASILDLLPQVDRLLGTGAQSADLAHYVHHQTRDRYDVLRSKPEVLATEQRFDAGTVDSIHAVAAKFYRLVFIDSGNDETDPMWLRAIECADQIVVPTIGEAKGAESAALLLEGLAARGGHFSTLADQAVVVVSKHKHDLPETEFAKLAQGFEGLARDVVTIPYDPALGAHVLNYGALRPQTQRSWLAAGAAVAGGL